MRVVDLSETHERDYFTCLEPYSPEIREAGSDKERWYRRMRDQGLRVKVALDDRERAVGFIQYVPGAHAAISGEGVYMILCIWVHGHREGVGPQQGHGVGTDLLAAAEADVMELGAKGMAAWGLVLPVWMRAAWFRKHGYRRVDRDGIRALMFKPFTPGASPPQWLRLHKVPVTEPGSVTITACHSGWCPARNVTLHRADDVATQLGLELRIFDSCCDRLLVEEWGADEVLFIDDRIVHSGPPLSREKLRKMMLKQLRRKRLAAVQG